MYKNLNTILDEINPDILKAKNKNLIETGIISSFDLINIVSEIEAELSIEMSLDDIVADNFVSYDKIEQLFFKYAKRINE